MCLSVHISLSSAFMFLLLDSNVFALHKLTQIWKIEKQIFSRVVEYLPPSSTYSDTEEPSVTWKRHPDCLCSSLVSVLSFPAYYFRCCIPPNMSTSPPEARKRFASPKMGSYWQPLVLKKNFHVHSHQSKPKNIGYLDFRAPPEKELVINESTINWTRGCLKVRNEHTSHAQYLF